MSYRLSYACQSGIFQKIVIFLDKKIRYNKKMMNTVEIMDRLKRGELSLPPLSLKMINVEYGDRLGDRRDAIIEAQWGEKCYRFVVDVKSVGTPKIMQAACNYVRMLATPPETYPMVVVPYLSRKKLTELEKQGISGIDLNGNGIVIVPNELLVVRSGELNRFRQSDPIRNVYKRNTSLVARAFLVKPTYSAVKEILELIKSRQGSITFSTISKALKVLEEDLVINRNADEIRLVQPDKLLEQLVEYYVSPRVRERFAGRCDLPIRQIVEKLRSAAKSYGARLALTGSGSADKYAVMAREPILSMYCSEPPSILIPESKLEVETTDRFANLELFETNDELVYFDVRDQERVPYSSPVQAYLELMRGDKRQREVAGQLKQQILSSISYDAERQ